MFVTPRPPYGSPKPCPIEASPLASRKDRGNAQPSRLPAPTESRKRQSPRFKQMRQIIKCRLHGRRHMLKNFAGDYEVVTGILRRFHNVETRFLVIKSVPVTQTLCERRGNRSRIAHAETANLLLPRKFLQRKAAAEKLHRKRMHDPAKTHIGSAFHAAGDLAIQRLRAALRAANITREPMQLPIVSRNCLTESCRLNSGGDRSPGPSPSASSFRK